jgi:hypothetical protein
MPECGVVEGDVSGIIDSCQPREGILQGTFNPEIFTASLSQVVQRYRGRGGTIDNLYTDAVQFFGEGTHPTDGMRRLLREALLRLSGDNTAPAIYRLETAFGGGKTHTLIALTHLAIRGNELAAVAAPLIDGAPLPAPGACSLAGVAGDELAVHRPQGPELVPYTLWGEIAYQIGGEALYRDVGDDATALAAPGSRYFDAVFKGRKALVMLDELAQYAARLEAARPNGAEQLAAFLLALHGYARTHGGLVVVVTLASQADAFARQTRRMTELLAQVRGGSVSEAEADAISGRATRDTQSVVARDATPVIPIQAAELSRILAKRLFTAIDPTAARRTAESYHDLYARSSAVLPDEAVRPDYRDRIASHYPFHPAFLDFLNTKLATIETFQGTRGVLRLLALVVRDMWAKQCRAPMVHTCHVNLREPRIVDEILGRTGSAELKTVLDTDIGGPDTGMLAVRRSRAEIADGRNPHPAGFSWHELTWRTVFLHSLVGRSEGLASKIFGITEREALFETAFPELTPPQVETALREIENSAFYLRVDRDRGRYFASLEPSINRALAEIQGGLRDEPVDQLLAVTARKIVAPDNGLFKVIPDVTAPEHVPDNSGRPVLGIASLGADRLDPAAIVETKGPHETRVQQNTVFLLVPETVFLDGDTWSEDRVQREREAQNRIADLARTVLALRRLKDQPQDYGIRPEQLDRDGFDARMHERELALQTAVTGLYRFLCFPQAGSGAVVCKEIAAAPGEGGAALLAEIRKLLTGEGELLGSDRATTNETLIGVGKLFFDFGQTPSLARLREGFLCCRRWPVLERPDLFEQIVRAGVAKGYWCLFDMGGSERTTPERFYNRETGEVPFDADLNSPGWCLVSLAGAKQRGWGVEKTIDPTAVVPWVAAAIGELGVTTAGGIAQQVTEKHGKVPVAVTLQAIDQVLREGRAMAFAGAPTQEVKPDRLIHGSAALFYQATPDDAVIAPAEAAKRGWICREEVGYRLSGAEASRRLWPLLGQLGCFYNRGARTTVTVLDLADLEIEGGGRLRLSLQDAAPAAMKRLGEFFEVLAGAVKAGADTSIDFEVAQPDDGCPLIQALKEGRAH